MVFTSVCLLSHSCTLLCDILYKRLRNILTYLLTYLLKATGRNEMPSGPSNIVLERDPMGRGDLGVEQQFTEMMRIDKLLWLLYYYYYYYYCYYYYYFVTIHFSALTLLVGNRKQFYKTWPVILSKHC